MNQDTKYAGLSVFIIVAVILLLVIAIPSEPKCSMGGCDDEAKAGSSYCYLHDLSYRSYGNPDYHEVYENSKRKQKEYSSTEKESSSNNSSSGVTTKKQYSYSDSSYSGNDSYDDGYDDIYDNDDYDSDRYEVDDDYAAGVDDAMDELDW